MKKSQLKRKAKIAENEIKARGRFEMRTKMSWRDRPRKKLVLGARNGPLIRPGKPTCQRRSVGTPKGKLIADHRYKMAQRVRFGKDVRVAAYYGKERELSLRIWPENKFARPGRMG